MAASASMAFWTEAAVHFEREGAPVTRRAEPFDLIDGTSLVAVIDETAFRVERVRQTPSAGRAGYMDHPDVAGHDVAIPGERVLERVMHDAEVLAGAEGVDRLRRLASSG